MSVICIRQQQQQKTRGVFSQQAARDKLSSHAWSNEAYFVNKITDPHMEHASGCSAGLIGIGVLLFAYCRPLCLPCLLARFARLPCLFGCSRWWLLIVAAFAKSLVRTYGATRCDGRRRIARHGIGYAAYDLYFLLLSEPPDMTTEPPNHCYEHERDSSLLVPVNT